MVLVGPGGDAAGASLVLVGEAKTRSLVLVGVFSAAMFAQAYIPAGSALLVDYSRPRDRVPTFALFRVAMNVGAALGPLIAILVVPHGLHVLFLLDAATYLLFAAWLGVGLPSTSHSAATAPAADTSARTAGLTVAPGRIMPPGC